MTRCVGVWGMCACIGGIDEVSGIACIQRQGTTLATRAIWLNQCLEVIHACVCRDENNVGNFIVYVQAGL